MNITVYQKPMQVKRRIWLPLLLTTIFICTSILQDYMEAGFNRFSFYFSPTGRFTPRSKGKLF